MVTEREELGGGVVVLAVGGDIEAFSSPLLKEEVFAILDGGARRLIVDLTDAEFIDSTGLGVLVAGLKRACGRELCVVCPRGEIRRLFGIVGLDRVFTMEWSRAAALRRPLAAGAGGRRAAAGSRAALGTGTR